MFNMTSELKIHNFTAKRNSTITKPQQNGVAVISLQDKNFSLPRTETTKVRRVSVANNRVIVKHLRKRLDSVREQRSTAAKDIAENDGEKLFKVKLTSGADKHTKKNTLSTPDSTHKVSTSSSDRKMNGYIRTNGYNIRALEYFFSGDSALPSIVVDEHDASVMTESDQRSTVSRRAETPGIFVDWKSEAETPEIGNQILFDDEFSDASRVLTHHNEDKNTTKNLDTSLSDVDTGFSVQKRKLKIFVSGDDTVLRERELLMTRIFPRLSNLARSNGLLLEIVNLNETLDGVDPDELRKTHIDNAVKTSVGTAFVTFLSSDANEDIPVPVNIPEHIMNKIFSLISLEILVHDAKIYHILRETRQNNNVAYESQLADIKKVRFSDETSVPGPLEEILYRENDRIHKCYQIKEFFLQEYELDQNAMPPIYVLKQKRRTKETDENLLENMQKYLARLLFDPTARSWTEETFTSTLLKDISTALDLSSDPKTNFLCFYRSELDDRRHAASHKQGEDIKTKVRSKIGYNNMREYKLTRNETIKFNQGKPATLADSSTIYLEKLEFDLYNTISLQTNRMTEAAINEAGNEGGSIVDEHTRFLQGNCKYFTGRKSTLEEIRKYMVSEYEKVPLAVSGEPGCGLSSIMSVAASRTEEWIKHRSCLPDIRYRRQNRKTITLFRSVGLTAETLSTKHLLFGICKQLQGILNRLPKIENRSKVVESPEIILGSAQQMAFLVKSTLMSLIEEKYLIVIFIDNLNAAHDDKGKFSLSWIPKPLPKYVKVVLSFSSNAKPIYCPRQNDIQPENMQEAYFSQYKVKSKILQVPALANCETLETRYTGKPTKATSILSKQLLKCQRKLTPMQESLLLQAANSSLNPLSLKLLVGIAKTWRSDTPISECSNTIKDWGRNMENFCFQFLLAMRRSYNKVLFRAFVCFITCSRSGLTHQEIVDLTSRDKRVSREFVTHPVKEAVKSCGSRCHVSFVVNTKLYELLDDFGELLVETLSDDVPTIKWRHSHSVFESQVYKMFMETAEDWKYYHRIMLAYFSNKSDVCSCGKTHEGCQPLRWNSCTRTFLNKRRVNESLFHAMQCDNIDVIKKEMLFDIEWLQTKLEATSIESLSDELYRVLKMKPDDSDVKLLTEALYLSHEVLCHDSQQLSSQLLGRLNDVIAKDIPSAPEDPRKYPQTRILLSQIRRRHFSFLMPSKTCLTSGKQVIYDALHGHEDVITAIASCTDGQRIITASKDATIKIWDVIERRVLRTIANVGRDVSSMCVCMGNYYVATIHKQNQVNVWSLLKCEKVLTVKDYDPYEKISLTVASEGQLLAIVSNSSANIRVWDLDKLLFHREVDVSPEKAKNVDLSVARSSRGNNAFIGYKGHSEAVVVNIKRGKIARTLSCENGRLTQVETSREYYIIGCRQRRMEVHELHYFYLYDSINYGLIRILKSCADDLVFDFFVNRLGSHLIGLCVSPHGDEELVVWSTEGVAHRHMIRSKDRYLGGTCTDLQYCMTACETESVVRIHNLAAQITKHDHSRTQVRKKVDGIGRLFNMPHHEKYVVAQGTSGSPITIWNVARSSCRGEAVIIERGLLDKNDIVVVKDVLVVILSDRGMVTMNQRSQQVFETIYVYNLLLRKYERKLHPVRINMCPPDHYHILGKDKLIATSVERISLVVWSIVTGEVLYRIHSNFPSNQVEKKINTRTKKKKNRYIGPFSKHKPTNTIELPKKRTTWKKGRVTDEDRQKTIFEMVVSADDTTLVCSYYSRHLAVFDLDSKTHRHTLSDRHSLLQLHKAIITRDGSFLLSTNYDDAAHCSYVTLWDLKEGCVARRRRDEPKVCSLAMTKDASRIVFVTEDNFIKIWDPFRRRSHRSIAGYPRLDLSCSDGDDAQATTIFITDDGQQAILYANSLSVWDLKAEKLLMVFEPDVKFQCCTVALKGQVIVVGMRDSPNITTLRVPPMEGRTTLKEEDRFGEGSESSDDSSGDEDEEK